MRVIIESPFAGETEEEAALNEEYLNAALAHSLGLGEAPFASHGIYPRKGVLDDTIPEERRKGIDAGFEWREVAEKTVFYGDRGITKGMIEGLEHSIDIGVPITFRSLDATPRSIDPPSRRWGASSDPGEFSERAALEWLRAHPTVAWSDEDRYGHYYHLSMMFGGIPDDVYTWNHEDDGGKRYIVESLRRHHFRDGQLRKVFVPLMNVVNSRLTELAQG